MHRRILVLSPHTDDGELGCGAMLAKAIDEGDEVFYLAFTGAEKSVIDGYPKDILRQEVKQSTSTLGIRPENIDVLYYPVREFHAYRQEILEDLVRINKQLEPHIVLLPSLRDRHQDHQVIANEGLRAFKNSSLLSYELVWNHVDFSAQAFVEVEEKHVQKKISALASYQSQAHRPYMTAAFIMAWATMRGVQCGKLFAEALEVHRIFL